MTMRRSNTRASTKPMRRSRALWGVIVAAAVVVATLGVGAEPASAANAIENGFAQPGPNAVTWDDGPGGCGPNQTRPTTGYTYVYPTNLTSNHPIIAWGNGSGATTCDYEDLLMKWASQGFVVVAANTPQSGRGNEILWGAAVTINQSTSDSSSPFYQKLDTTSVAAAGHSQGAVGAINATVGGNGLFESVLAMSTPNRDALTAYNGSVCFWLFGLDCIPVEPPPLSAMNNLGAPIFFARGTGLDNTSPCELDDWMSNKTSHPEHGWYPTNTSVPFADATAHVPPPTDPGDCGGINDWFPYPHVDFPENFHGYSSAWFAYTLQGNMLARAAFVGSSAEIDNNPKWSQVELENLP